MLEHVLNIRLVTQHSSNDDWRSVIKKLFEITHLAVHIAHEASNALDGLHEVNNTLDSG